MTRTGRPSVWDARADEMVRLYKTGLTFKQVAKAVGCSDQTATKYIMASGTPITKRNPNAGRTSEQQAEINARVSASRQGKGTGPRKPVEHRTCKKCGKDYEYRPGKTGAKYCSRACNLADVAANRVWYGQESYAADPVRCPCGQPIPYEHRHGWLYCSEECRKTYGLKRQPDPSNYVIFNCETCGNEVTRYRKYGNGASRFCSNACSARSYNVKARLDDVVFDSSWEALFWGLCRFLKVPVDRVDRSTAITFGTKTYAPDFIVGDIAVEIKGLEDDDDRERVRAWREQVGPVAVIEEGRLDVLRRTDSSEHLLILLGAFCRSYVAV